jgi:hypothetical protein
LIAKKKLTCHRIPIVGKGRGLTIAPLFYLSISSGKIVEDSMGWGGDFLPPLPQRNLFFVNTQ